LRHAPSALLALFVEIRLRGDFRPGELLSNL
jgi:hypothetical protein